jgi:hypothetical protein
LRYGYRVLYRTSAQLFSNLTTSLADKALPARLRYYANPDGSSWTNVGFDKIECAELPGGGASALQDHRFRQSEARSIATVINVGFDKWGDYLSDGPLAMAFLDYLVEESHYPKVKVNSYQAEKAKSAETHSSQRTVSLPIWHRYAGCGYGITTQMAPLPLP